MRFPDQYHVAAVWQQHILDEKKQRRLAELTAQRRKRRGWTTRGVLAAVFRRRPRTIATAAPSRPVGCVV